jgi:hypothetical protein
VPGFSVSGSESFWLSIGGSRLPVLLVFLCGGDLGQFSAWLAERLLRVGLCTCVFLVCLCGGDLGWFSGWLAGRLLRVGLCTCGCGGTGWVDARRRGCRSGLAGEVCVWGSVCWGCCVGVSGEAGGRSLGGLVGSGVPPPFSETALFNYTHRSPHPSLDKE